MNEKDILCWAKESSEDLLFLAQTFPQYKSLLIAQITNASDAINWVQEFPQDRPKLIHLVTNEEFALWWAHAFSQDRSKLIHLITRHNNAANWILWYPEDLSQLWDKLTALDQEMFCMTLTSKGSYYLAKYDKSYRNKVITFITDPEWAFEWVKLFPGDKLQMFKIVSHSSKWCFRWAQEIP